MTQPNSPVQPSSHDRPRRASKLIAAGALFLIAIGLTGVVAQRLAQHQREHGRTIYAFKPVVEPRFIYAGNDVTLSGVPGDDANAHGVVQLSYGETTIDLPVPYEQRVYTENLPGLVEFEDWLRVLRFAPLSGRSAEALVAGIEAGEIDDRLCVVARVPRPGASDETWGRVWKRDWTFAIHELLPDGTIESHRFAYPQGRPYDEEPPTEVGGVPVLQPGTWEHDAALYVMPVGSGPKVRIIDSALRSVGWPFAGAVVSFSLAALMAILAAVPSREDIERRLADA